MAKAASSTSIIVHATASQYSDCAVMGDTAWLGRHIHAVFNHALNLEGFGKARIGNSSLFSIARRDSSPANRES
ncbi:hypothetical protein [Neisseria animalis]|uniref:hypothetical protein n=1 Tax=Neisseria animalis TaxID=492 RepID=UPI000F5018D4|nr:hypothetical protein [Neisseria animalis]